MVDTHSPHTGTENTAQQDQEGYGISQVITNTLRTAANQGALSQKEDASNPQNAQDPENYQKEATSNAFDHYDFSKNQQNQSENYDDINLDDVIGNAFKSVQDADSSQKSPSDDDDLQDAIGAAFANAFGGKDDELRGDKSDTENNHDNRYNSEDYYSQENVEGGDVPERKDPETNHQSDQEIHEEHEEGPQKNQETYEGTQGNQEKYESTQGNHEAQKHQSIKEHNTENHQDDQVNYNNQDNSSPIDEDESLNDVIGNAFASFMEDKTSPEPTEEKGDQLNQVIEKVFGELIQREDKDQGNAESEHDTTNKDSDKTDHDGDLDLDEAIGNAFKSIMPQAEEKTEDAKSQDDDLANVISASFKKAMANQDKLMESAVSDAFRAATDEADNFNRPAQSSPDKCSLPQDVLSRIVSEIKEQLAEDDAKIPKSSSNIPQLDDNVLKHFDTEAHRQEENREKAADLESLQMNDILQNAFNMAMENPYELLQDMEMDEGNFQKGTVPSQDSSKKETAKDTSNTEGDSKKKELSIAETLALHRSNMASIPRRNYAQIESLNEVLKANKGYTGPISSQISNVINTITKNDTSKETNVMSAIKEMMHILTTDSRGPGSTPANVTEVLNNYQDKEERSFIVKSLLLAKNFLISKGPTSVDNSRAMLLVDTILKHFGREELDRALTEEEKSVPGALNRSFDAIKDVSKSVLTAMVNQSQSSKGETLVSAFKRKPLETEEAKELIRMENRARKKRWREENAERNKDNDLRSRVWKKASVLFGDEDSPKKRDWIDAEFKKRREKRIARQGKQTNHSDDKEDGEDRFKKPLVDIFNMLSAFANLEDLNAVLAATSAATASSLVLYTEKKVPKDDIVSTAKSTLSSIMDSVQQTGVLKKLATLPQSTGVGSALPEKRTYPETSHAEKKQKPEGRPSNAWGTSTSLRMPHYRKPSVSIEVSAQTNKVENPILTLPTISPFISNKVQKPQQKAANPGTLRRPGTFQRPPTREKGKSLGYPQLLSSR